MKLSYHSRWAADGFSPRSPAARPVLLSVTIASATSSTARPATTVACSTIVGRDAASSMTARIGQIRRRDRNVPRWDPRWTLVLATSPALVSSPPVVVSVNGRSPIGGERSTALHTSSVVWADVNRNRDRAATRDGARRSRDGPVTTRTSRDVAIIPCRGRRERVIALFRKTVALGKRVSVPGRLAGREHAIGGRCRPYSPDLVRWLRAPTDASPRASFGRRRR